MKLKIYTDGACSGILEKEVGLQSYWTIQIN